MRRVFCFAVLIAVAFTAGAGAHTPEDRSVFWINNEPTASRKCGLGLTRIAHGNYGHGFARSNTYATTFAPLFGGQACEYPWARPQGHIRARFTYQRKTNGQWAFCDNGDIHTNSGVASSPIDGRWQVETYRNYARSPCRKGVYRVVGYHAVLWNWFWREGYGGWNTDHYFD